MLSSRIQLLIVILGVFFACRYHMLVFHGWSCCDVRDDLGSLVSLKLLFGFGNRGLFCMSMRDRWLVKEHATSDSDCAA